MNPRKHHTNQIVMRIGRWSNEELRPGVNLLGGRGILGTRCFAMYMK